MKDGCTVVFRTNILHVDGFDWIIIFFKGVKSLNIQETAQEIRPAGSKSGSRDDAKWPCATPARANRGVKQHSRP